MDYSSAFRTEVFRPISTILVPGITAIAPYAALVNHYNPEVHVFLVAYPAAYFSSMVLASIAAGLILEDVGSRVESLIWDPLIEKETACQSDDWIKFLKIQDEEVKVTVGHRYLRTLTLRLKFELSFGFAVLFAWIGLLWMDSVEVLWRPTSVVVLSAIVVSTTGYVLWESYATAWVLADVRHILITGGRCNLEPRNSDPPRRARWFDRSLLMCAIVYGAWAIGLVVSAAVNRLTLGYGSGITTSLLLGAFAIVLLLTWNWHRSDPLANGRRRGTAVRLSFAFGLACLFLVTRAKFTHTGWPIPLAIATGLCCVGYLYFGERLWNRDVARLNRLGSTTS